MGENWGVARHPSSSLPPPGWGKKGRLSPIPYNFLQSCLGIFSHFMSECSKLKKLYLKIFLFLSFCFLEKLRVRRGEKRGDSQQKLWEGKNPGVCSENGFSRSFVYTAIVIHQVSTLSLRFCSRNFSMASLNREFSEFSTLS